MQTKNETWLWRLYGKWQWKAAINLVAHKLSSEMLIGSPRIAQLKTAFKIFFCVWQIVAFNRTGSRPALNQAVGYVRVAHIVLRGPLGPLSPTADKRLMILKMAVSSTKMAPDSEPFVCCKIHPCILQLATHCHSGRRPGSRRGKASLPSN